MKKRWVVGAFAVGFAAFFAACDGDVATIDVDAYEIGDVTDVSSASVADTGNVPNSDQIPESISDIVFAEPPASFCFVNVDTISAGESATWFYTSRSGKEETFSWVFPEGPDTSSTEASVTITYPYGGQYSGKVVVKFKGDTTGVEIECANVANVIGDPAPEESSSSDSTLSSSSEEVAGSSSSEETASSSSDEESAASSSGEGESSESSEGLTLSSSSEGESSASGGESSASEGSSSSEEPAESSSSEEVSSSSEEPEVSSSSEKPVESSSSKEPEVSSSSEKTVESSSSEKLSSSSEAVSSSSEVALSSSSEKPVESSSSEEGSSSSEVESSSSEESSSSVEESSSSEEVSSSSEETVESSSSEEQQEESSSSGEDESIENAQDGTVLTGGKTYEIQKCRDYTSAAFQIIAVGFENCLANISTSTPNYWSNTATECRGEVSSSFPLTITVPEGATVTITSCH